AIGYPGRENEIALLERQHREQPLSRLSSVTTPEEVMRAVQAVREVHVAAELRTYIVTIVETTRAHTDVFLGASPRGSLALYNLSRGLAWIRGRDYVTPDDIKALSIPALAHRIVLHPSARMAGHDGREVVSEIVRRVPVPGGATDNGSRRGRVAALRGEG
ncbi:MAG TPA: MoxR family ATPase, partial [Thermomicrobiales bacterium]|nr:MoxR family ATPase [Thermomicrobiales bacterium]